MRSRPSCAPGFMLLLLCSRFVVGVVRVWGTHACGVDGALEYEMVINGSYPGCAPLASRTESPLSALDPVSNDR